MRLLLVTQDFPPARGGIQTWALELAKRLAERCERFAVVAPRARTGGTVEADAGLGFPVIRTGSPDTLIAASAPALTELVIKERFEHTLHAQWSTAPAALALRAGGCLRSVSIAAHGRELLLEPWRRMRAAQHGYDFVRRQALTRADHVLAGSEYTAALVRDRGVAPERVHVTHYGTDPERFTARDASPLRERLGLRDRPLLLSIARLVPRKGIDTVLHALSKLKRELPDVAYVIAGEGPDRERLVALARAEGLESNVIFRGAVPDSELSLWYSLGDVFVMPSRSEVPDVEGFGIVFLEAAAAERPVVAARAGGVPDAVADGVTGLLVRPDDAEELSHALRRLLGDAALRSELGRRGRERVLAQFTWNHVVDRTLAVLGSA